MGSVEEYVAAGLYDPDEPAHSGRLELLAWLEQQGLSVAEIARWAMDQSVAGVAGDRRMVPGERRDRATALARTGLSGDEFDAYSVALGLMPIHGAPAGEVGYTDEEIELLATVAALTSMFSEEQVLAVIRVIGSSLSRIAEAAVSMFLTDVEAPHVQAGMTELELARKVYDGAGLVDGLAERLDPILRRQIQQAVERNRRASIDELERLQYRFAVGFVDLVGFTALSGRLPTDQLASFIDRFESQAQDVIVRAGGRVVKLIGDEVMFVATDPSAACVAALGLIEAFSVDFEGVVPRGGLAFGKVLLRGGDYYGPVVNLASRLVDLAVPMEILVTAELAEAANTGRFEPAGRRQLKGFDQPVQVHTLLPA
jgi:adenylate cyclase